MFAFAGLLLVPWLWFQFGIGIAVCYIIFITALIVPLLKWRAVGFILVGVIVVFALERHTIHTLVYANQHEQFPLTICADPVFRAYDDVHIGNAFIYSQPSTLSLRNVSVVVPNKFDISYTPGLCIAGVFRAKQPFSTLVPQQFNADQYYYSQKIDAKLTLVSLDQTFEQNKLMYRLHRKVVDQFEDDVNRQLWAALVLGWSSGMSSELKALLANNQLAHMFVVSGFHIGVIALFVNGALYLLAKLVAPIYRINMITRYMAVVIITTFYVAFIGWPIPALRALIMAVVPLLCAILKIRLHPYQSILLSAVIVLILFPETWLGIGNWLSFGSVMVIVMAYRWQLFARFSVLVSLLVFQLLMSLLSLFWCYFYGVSFNLLGFFINLIASPLVTFVIFPLAILIAISPMKPITVFELVVHYCLNLIEQTADYGIRGSTVYSGIVLCIALFCILIMWLPQRKISLSWWLSLAVVGSAAWYVATYIVDAIPSDEIHIRFFDVGHGLAALIRVNDQSYLYDTGGRVGRVDTIYGRKLSALMPQLTGLIVSHSDSDHAAGAKEAMAQFPNASVFAGQPEVLGANAQSCHQHQINSPFLYFIAIPVALRESDNDQSCILVVHNQQFSMILTGDASRRIEYYLMQTYSNLFPFSAVLLGHHGSDTSSVSAWLDSNKGAMFINSGGDLARGSWPSKRIKQWFELNSIRLENTAKRGTIDIIISKNKIRSQSSESAFRKRLIY